MESQWDVELAEFLNELSATQEELLLVLGEKRQLLAKADVDGMKAMQPREQELAGRLQACHERRGSLLNRAAEQGRPADSIRSLAASLPHAQQTGLAVQVQHCSGRARLLAHHSLTNWVLVQRTLLHLSQLIEIIATGGRRKPTYGKGEDTNSTGALVDQAA